MGRFFRRGQAILEAALVLPILLVIIFGVFGIGQLMAGSMPAPAKGHALPRIMG
jgi:Flp pilus assembly protein TadG